MPDRSAPSVAMRAQRDRRDAAERDLLIRLTPPRRIVARRVLALARTFLPLRETGKAAFVQSIDGGRAACRALGRALATDATLAEAEDVRFLTVDELLGTVAADIRDRVTERRRGYEEYRGYRLPDRWTGEPVPIRLGAATPTATALTDTPGAATAPVTGIPVSSGRVEGVARVITDPHRDELDVDEIMVCETTDPSWAAFFLVASAVVIDIGGPISHGAIIARELGIPCVINTRDGSRRIRSGQRIRVDGDAGTVTLLD